LHIFAGYEFVIAFNTEYWQTVFRNFSNLFLSHRCYQLLIILAGAVIIALMGT